MPNTQAPILDVPDNGGEFAADSGQHPAPILEVRDLEVEFAVDDGKIKVLDGVSFKVAPGQTLGIVGESGCGKSVTSLAIMGLLPKPHGQVVAGSIRFQGEELLSLAPDQMYKVRGNRISMIFQEPMTALNPVQTVGEQLMEVFRLHRPEYDKAQRKAAAIAMLQKVGIPEPAQRFAVYPHNLSGGMRQRVMIAMALSCEPDLLICDEPTTALDVTIQAQILELMKELQAQTGMAIIFITHDLGVVAELCDEVVVMYAGRAVEQADVFELFDHPRHPYTHGLMSSIPRLEDEPKSLLKTIKGQVPALHEMPAGCRFSNRCPPRDRSLHQRHSGGGATQSAPPCRLSLLEGVDRMSTLLSVRDLKQHFRLGGGFLRKQYTVYAVDGISFDLKQGETLGLVGESGCGKSTLGRSLLKLFEPTAGTITFEGRDITALSPKKMRSLRQEMQMVFQDPAESLNSRHTVGQILEEPFIIHGKGNTEQRRGWVQELLAKVGLPGSAVDRYPHEFSGGQRQRIGIARAIALKPKLLVCDEAVSALDVSVQSQIVNLLLSLQREMNLSIIFIAHDLSVVKHISDRIAVMYLGRIVELADAQSLYLAPRHPYTQALISAIPVPDPRRRSQRILLTGDVPSPHLTAKRLPLPPALPPCDRAVQKQGAKA